MAVMREAFDPIIARARDLLSRSSCEFAEIRLSSGWGTAISLSGDQVETLSSGETIGGSVRVLCDGSWGFVTFNDLSGLERFFRRGVSLASAASPPERSVIRACPPVEKNFTTIMEKDVGAVPMDEKFRLISSYNRILKSSPYAQTTRATYRDVSSYYAYLNTEGSAVTYDRTYCGVSLSVIARDGSVIQPYHDSVSGYGGFEIAENREDMAERVVKTGVDLLKAESVPGGIYRVVVDQKLAGVFIHEAFGHLSEADHVYENEQLRKIMTIGKEFGPEGLTVIDRGDMPELSGYIPVDDEGVLPGKTCLIQNGRLHGRLHSRETAGKMNEATTGNARAISVTNPPIVRMTNTYIENGGQSRDEIFDEAGDGIYAVGNIGGQTNLEMFTFTAECGYEIKNGKPGRLFKDIVLSGNVFTTLRNIALIGDDRKMFGGLGGCGKGGQSPLPVSFGGPHMLINDVLIGGAR